MEVLHEKICTKCGLLKSLDEFSNVTKSHDGKAWACKACAKIYNAARATKPKSALLVKVCTKCLATKSIDEFGLDKSTKDGRATRCLLCKCAESAVYRGENPEKVRAAVAKWDAENPEKNKAWREANKERRSIQRKARYAADPAKENAQNAANYAANKDEWRPTRQAWEAAHAEERREYHIEQYLLRDPEERRAQGRAWNAANPEKVRAKNNRRRARKKNAPINDLTAAQWDEIQVAQAHRCYYCGKRCKDKLTQDHLTPLSQGGSHTLHNVIGACLSCNSKKHAGPPLTAVQPLLLSISASRKPKKKGT